MRAIETSIALVATLIALQACSHPAVTRAATPATAGAVRAASDASDRARAERLVWGAFTGEEVNVGIVEVHKTDKPGVYDYVCDYDKDFPEKRQFCFYTAKGQVDIKAEDVTVTSRRRGGCHPLDARTR